MSGASGGTDRAALLARIRAALRSQVGDNTDDDTGEPLHFGETPGGAYQSLADRLGHLAANNQPIADLFDNAGDEASARAGIALINGLSQGPLAIAGQLAQALSIPQHRAETIARNELVSSYRDAQMANYRANSDVVGQWMWSAALGSACIVCSDMDGTIHSMDEDLVSHVMCRCSPLPVTRSWSDIMGSYGLSAADIPETRITESYGTGKDWFYSQSEATQISIMGPAKFEAWQRGDISLDDLVGVRQDGEWGGALYEKSLKELGLDARDYLPKAPLRGLGPRGSEAVRQSEITHLEASMERIELPGGGYTYVLRDDASQFDLGSGGRNVEADIEHWQSIDDVMAGLRGETTETVASEAEAGALDMSVNPDVKFISEADVAKWTAGNVEDVPRIGYHNTSEEGKEHLLAGGVDVNQSKVAFFGDGFYMFDSPDPAATFGPAEVRVAVHMDNPLVLSFDDWSQLRTELWNEWGRGGEYEQAFLRGPAGSADAKALAREFDAFMRQTYLDRGYDGLIVNDAHVSGTIHDREIIAIKPGTVRVINDEKAAAEAETTAATEATGAAEPSVTFATDAVHTRLMERLDNPSDAEFARLMGAQTGDRVEVDRAGQVFVRSDDYTAMRWVLSPDESTGDVGMLIGQYATPGGTPLPVDEQFAKLLGTQVSAAQDSGGALSYLSIKARPGQDDYERLLALGFDAPIDMHVLTEAQRLGPPLLPAEFAAKFPGVETLGDLVSTPAGAQWWHDNGMNPDLTFDLTPGSVSTRRLNAYLRAHEMEEV